MKSAKITISYPLKEDKVKVAGTKLAFNEDKSIYQVIDHIRDKRLDKELKYEIKTPGTILLKDLITLHNIPGIQKRNKLLSMISNIKSGLNIFEFESFPNVGIAVSENEEYVIFDGHHTILSYLSAGKKLLCEVPHILVNSDKGIENKEFLVFFGNHKNEIPVDKWKDYCINWNVSSEKQIVPREQQTIGEVFEELNKT